MKNSKRLGILLLSFSVILATISGCKRYEDGPQVSFIPKKYRLVGKWKIKTINGEDPNSGNGNGNSGTIHTSCNTTISYTSTQTNDDVYEFKSSGELDVVATNSSHSVDYNASYSQCAAVYMDSDDSQTITGDYKFKQGGRSIELTVAGETSRFDILRLTQKELWLFGGNDKIKFEKK